MSDKPTYQRKKVYINPKFQSHTILFFIVLAFFSIIQVFYFGWNNMDLIIRESSVLNLEVGHPYLIMLEKLQSTFIKLSIISAVATVAGFTVGGLYFSHRIAGPIYKIRLHLAKYKESGANDFEPIHLRDGDYFTELAEDINSVFTENDNTASQPKKDDNN